jgi:hypothetical protein
VIADQGSRNWDNELGIWAQGLTNYNVSMYLQAAVSSTLLYDLSGIHPVLHIFFSKNKINK